TADHRRRGAQPAASAGGLPLRRTLLEAQKSGRGGPETLLRTGSRAASRRRRPCRLPLPGGRRSMSEQNALLTVEDLKKYYPLRGGVFGAKIGDLKAVDGVSFTVKAGETL